MVKEYFREIEAQRDLKVRAVIASLGTVFCQPSDGSPAFSSELSFLSDSCASDTSWVPPHYFVVPRNHTVDLSKNSCLICDVYIPSSFNGELKLVHNGSV